MNIKLFSLLLLGTFSGYQSFSQTYISFTPGLTNTAGTIADKSNIALEVGRQWEVFSLGLA